MSGYRISSNFGNLNTTGNVYGFLSSVNQNNKFGTAVENYNFYAEGTAPNYFAGNTYIGGTTNDLGETTNITFNW